MTWVYKQSIFRPIRKPVAVSLIGGLASQSAHPVVVYLRTDARH